MSNEFLSKAQGRFSKLKEIEKTIERMRDEVPKPSRSV